MNERDPELNNQDPSHVAFTDADIGHLLLIQASLENPLSPTEERQLKLIDIQARHHRQLHESGLLWRAVIAASEYDVKQENVKPMPEVPYQVKVFKRPAILPDKRVVHALGVRFVTQEPDATGNYAPTNYDVCIVLDNEPYPPFTEDEAGIIIGQITELSSLQEELQLSSDLTQVRLPADA